MINIPFRPTSIDLLAVAGVTVGSLASQFSSTGALTVLATGAVTYFLGRASNRKLLAEADKIKQEANGLLLRNTRDLLSLKEKECNDYKQKLEDQAHEHKRLTEQLNEKLERLEDQVTALKNTVEKLTAENSHLTNLLSKRLRQLFLSTPEGDIQLILHPSTADRSTDSAVDAVADPDSSETVHTTARED